MTATTTRIAERAFGQDALSGTTRAHAIDRWIYVFSAALFIAIILTGFIPDSLEQIAAVQAGQRPPFPLVLHLHAVLMASFMLLLLTQTVLVATGRSELHMKVGLAAFVIVPALVLVGIVLVPTMYHQVSDALKGPIPPAVRGQLQKLVLLLDNIMLLQFRVGILFPLFVALALNARRLDPGFHKRMIILASAVPLPAAIDRITWLPTTLPASPLASDLYVLVAAAPIFVWDVVRNRRIHPAYLIWTTVYVLVSLLLYWAWNTPWWHAAAHRIMGA
jgi:hypothetical protein